MIDNNSMLQEVRALFAAIFRDLRAMHPSISTDLQRDLSRLLKADVSVGLKLYTIALPAGNKWFDKSLSTGRLVEPRPPHFGVKAKGDLRPSFLHGLFSLIFEPDGTLQSCVDISAVASIRQVLLAVKKLRMECESRYTDESVNDFLEIERSLPRNRKETWDSDSPRWSPRSGHPIWGDHSECDRQASLLDTSDSVLQLDGTFDWNRLSELAERILHQFGPFDPYGIRPKHGPGAVSDKKQPYIKYDMPFWTERLESVFPYDWHVSSNLTVPEYVKYEEHASKMVAVPKTQSGPRLIAAEPTAHQWIQQGIRGWLEKATFRSNLRYCVNFRSQEFSRQAALDASETGDFATVDLSSASDRLHCRLVEYIFQSRPDILDALHASRTRANVALNGELVLLRKFATQGSAVIFPLQTIVYSILAMFAVATKRRWNDKSYDKTVAKLVRVFGDDIIVPTDSYPVLARLLKTCLLKVNESKTHNSGFFRESCGMDAYKGVDVTPAYFREAYSASPEALESVIQVSNNFHRKGYWHTAEHILKTVPIQERRLLAYGEGIGSTAIFSYVAGQPDHIRMRWNNQLHRHEILTLRVTTNVPLTVSSREGSLRQFFFEEPDPDTPYQGGQAANPRSRKERGWVSPT